jgi:glycosyltransferase involved in cell wall biosynthesis
VKGDGAACGNVNFKKPRHVQFFHEQMSNAPVPNRQTFPRLAFVSGLGFGGAATFLCNLAGELARRGVPVIVVSPEKENPFAAEFQSAGVKVYLHDDRRVIFEDRMAGMLRILAEFQPTAVVGCLGGISYEILRYLPRGIRRVGMVQADHQMHFDGVLPYAGCMDDIVGVSKKITERLEQMDAFRSVAKRCLLHGVSVPPTVPPRGIDGPLRILYFGRISRGQKRVHLFPLIYQQLVERDIPFVWTIAGEDWEGGFLEREMPSRSATQRVIFPGPVPYGQVPALLQNHDVFLLASDSEGLPMSLLEAMAQGVVPVISDLESGVRDVVDSSNGMLVPVNDVAGYASAIIHLHGHRDELATKSAAAHARVKADFSVQAMANRWLQALSGPQQKVQWPSRWRIHAPLTQSHNPRFWPPVRLLRRWGAKYRS